MELKKFKLKNKKQTFIIIFSIFIGLILGYFLFGNSYAFYEEEKDFDVIDGTVDDPGDIYFAYYIDGTISRNMPAQNTGYTLDETKSNCNNGVIPTWDNAGWKFIGDYHNYSATDNTRTKCTLYFNKTSKTVSTALGNVEVNTYTPDFTKSACDDESCESHEKGIYETTDYDGNPTYYYRGSVENNYVKFAGYYWRIIRINSNGSIRMIYDGTSAHANGESSEDRQYGTSQFNSLYKNAMYSGYTYSSGEIHGTSTSSTIKTSIDNFYNSVLSKYTPYVDTNVGFCSDRTPVNNTSGVGTSTTLTYYKGYLRTMITKPTLVCENTTDYYTTSNAATGNKVLAYPVGLITVDEMIYAGHSGGVFDGTSSYQKSNINSYLTTGINFWLMTPAGYYNPFGDTNWYANIFFINTLGQIDDNYSLSSFGTKPVINIRSDVTITGNGTMTDPYILSVQ